MRRAVRDEQKEQRRQTIIDAAWTLFQMHAYADVSVADVAARVGLAKGTVYLYFETKEALFLAAQGQQIGAWFDDVDDRLQALPAGVGVETVAETIVASLTARPHLARLFAILHVILEHNIGRNDALPFKQMLLAGINRTGALLERRLLFLATGEGATVLLRTYALVIGVQHLADPAPIVQQLLATDPTLTVFAIDFADELTASLTALLHGHNRLSRS